MKGLKPEIFFQKVSMNSGISDLQTVKNVFYGLIKTLSREVRNNHFVEMPDWGRFVLKVRKSRRSADVNTGEILILPPIPELKFSPNPNVKKYFQSLM